MARRRLAAFTMRDVQNTYFAEFERTKGAKDKQQRRKKSGIRGLLGQTEAVPIPPSRREQLMSRANELKGSAISKATGLRDAAGSRVSGARSAIEGKVQAFRNRNNPPEEKKSSLTDKVFGTTTKGRVARGAGVAGALALGAGAYLNRGKLGSMIGSRLSKQAGKTIPTHYNGGLI